MSIRVVSQIKKLRLLKQLAKRLCSTKPIPKVSFTLNISMSHERLVDFFDYFEEASPL